MKQITILANSTRDQEGYSDTQMGVTLDIECELTDVGSFIIALKELDKEFKELYPPYTPSNDIEPDLTYRDAPNCHMFYRFNFSRINNNKSSSLHNISSLMSAYAAYRVAYVFRGLGYDIVSDERDSVSDKRLTISNSEAARSVCNDQMDCFLTFVSDSLYELGTYEYFDKEQDGLFEASLIEYDDSNPTQFLAQFEIPEFYELAMNVLADEIGGEFGFSDPIDRTIPFKDYNPFLSSDETFNTIDSFCNVIKYSKILKEFKKNIL